jgi:predicted MarR family transcription regulator
MCDRSGRSEPRGAGQASVPLTRDGLVDVAIAKVQSGSIPASSAGILDVLSEWLLSAALASDLPEVEASCGQILRLGAAVARRWPAACGAAEKESLAELRGATEALAWVGRLAQEALVGPGVDCVRYVRRTHACAHRRESEHYEREMSAELGRDKTQISRAGRKLLDSGLATVSRVGPSNHWRATAKGRAATTRPAE